MGCRSIALLVITLLRRSNTPAACSDDEDDDEDEDENEDEHEGEVGEQDENGGPGVHFNF